MRSRTFKLFAVSFAMQSHCCHLTLHRLLCPNIVLSDSSLVKTSVFDKVDLETGPLSLAHAKVLGPVAENMLAWIPFLSELTSNLLADLHILVHDETKVLASLDTSLSVDVLVTHHHVKSLQTYVNHSCFFQEY